ncbi:MAG TPA: aspartate aminotransferase family protein [Gemmatimonadaceae bacterium]
MRNSPAELAPPVFRAIGHDLVDRIADFLATLPDKPVAPALTPREMHARLGTTDSVPERGEDAAAIAKHAVELVIGNSTFNGHPRFFGYITSSASPIGALADMLAASVNPNCGAWSLSPVASEIEKQSVHWIADLIGYPTACGGLLVSGGNMANMVCLIAAIRAQAGWDVRQLGVAGGQSLRVYASAEVHTWLQKGADVCGLGTNAVRSVPVDETLAMDAGALERMIAEDRKAGHRPAVVIGTAGSVSTGAIDPLPQLAALCKREKIWFHVDGAYGAPAAVLPDAPAALRAMSLADSVAVDPHKWLYAPIEAGCSLVRDPEKLRNAFSFHPPYYRFEGDAEDPPTNFYEWGPQNSRGFRALKVWMTIRQVGRDGYVRMIRDDIALTRELCDLVRKQKELEMLTYSLSITTFRYVGAKSRDEKYLNELNAAILEKLQKDGSVYPSNAVIGGRFAIRACIVNFRTQSADVRALVEATVAAGRALDSST